jgi:hypothetical protein
MATTARDFLALEGLSARELTDWLDAAEAMMPYATGERPHPAPLPLAG